MSVTCIYRSAIFFCMKYVYAGNTFRSKYSRNWWSSGEPPGPCWDSLQTSVNQMKTVELKPLIHKLVAILTTWDFCFTSVLTPFRFSWATRSDGQNHGHDQPRLGGSSRIAAFFKWRVSRVLTLILGYYFVIIETKYQRKRSQVQKSEQVINTEKCEVHHACVLTAYWLNTL